MKAIRIRKRIPALLICAMLILTFSSCKTVSNDDNGKTDVIQEKTTGVKENDTEKKPPSEQTGVIENNKEISISGNNDTVGKQEEKDPKLKHEEENNANEIVSNNRDTNPEKDQESQNNFENDDGLYFPSKSAKNMNIDATMKAWNDTDQLYKEAYAIIVGTVTQADKQILYNNIDHVAASSVKVEKVIKGDIKEGDTIEIEETGVRMEYGDISIDGTPLLRKNMKVLLFLTETDDQVQGIPAYGIRGCYFGKFFYDENDVVYPATYFATENVIPLKDFSEPVKETAVMTNINSLANKYAEIK